MTYTAEQFLSNVDKSKHLNGCWLWTGLRNSQGYGQVLVAKGKLKSAHRLSYEFFIGPLSPKIDFVCHRCDNPPCVNPDHLFKGDRSTNMKDAGSKGRHWTQMPENKDKVKAMFSEGKLRSAQQATGFQRSGCKLTMDNLRDIIRLSDAGQKGSQISKALGIHAASTYQVIKGKTFRNEVKQIRMEMEKPFLSAGEGKTNG